jgi:hypothetical protein
MKNKRLQTFLLFLVLAIWGMVAFRVYGTMAPGESDGPESDITQANMHMPHESFVFKADVRDPFHFTSRIQRRDSSQISARLAKPVWTPPSLKLTGILQSKSRKKTVVLEDSAGAAFFLSEGDTLSGVKILKIGTNEVSYLFRKQKSQWMLEAQ